ncbi:hypothetical protein ACTXT7_007200 [Hymenolepis weldensis]
MSRRLYLSVMIDICLGIYVQTGKHTVRSPVDTAVEILSRFHMVKKCRSLFRVPMDNNNNANK